MPGPAKPVTSREGGKEGRREGERGRGREGRRKSWREGRREKKELEGGREGEGEKGRYLGILLDHQNTTRLYLLLAIQLYLNTERFNVNTDLLTLPGWQSSLTLNHDSASVWLSEVTWPIALTQLSLNMYTAPLEYIWPYCFISLF